MAKLPSFQFYPGDWLKDASLRVCSIFARGLLVDLLCVCFESKHRGQFVRPDGVTPWTDEQIVDCVCGSDRETKMEALNELREHGVLKRCEKGITYSARMMRDEDIRKMRTEHGSKGGSKAQANDRAKREQTVEQKPKQTREQKSTPSSSSSSSSSEEVKPPNPLFENRSEQTALPGAAPSSPGMSTKSVSLTSCKTTKPKRPQPEPIMIPDNLANHPGFADAWAKWEAYRREGRKTMTVSTRNLQLGMLAKHGPSKAIEMIATSITNGWTGLFPPDDKRAGRNGSTQSACIDPENYVGAPCMTDEEAGVPF